MSCETIDREIARLEAIGRTRALDVGEGMQLDRLIAMERRYARMASKAPGAVRAIRVAIEAAPSGLTKATDAPIGARVRFTLPTKAGRRTYEAQVNGHRANRDGKAGWIETVDDQGHSRSVAPRVCEVLAQ